jgi:hypothetical protein
MHANKNDNNSKKEDGQEFSKINVIQISKDKFNSKNIKKKRMTHNIQIEKNKCTTLMEITRKNYI